MLPEGAVLVTGASRGLGRSAALRLGESGATVAVHYRRAQAEAESVAEAIEQAGGRADIFQADLAISDQAASLVTAVESRLGPLYGLLNNAGITRDRLVIQMSEDDWAATWDTDLTGPRIVARDAVRCMTPRGTGSVVNVSSVVGTTGNAGQANYAAAKSAIQGFTRELAVEVAPHGVRVNCIIPGYVTTDATSHLTPEQQEVWLARIPMRRYAVAEEMADLVLFLLGTGSRYITGQCIAFDGGLQAASGWGFGS